MKKIGLIDSGIGGLTLLSGLLKHKINATFYYISDSNNVPYGDKPQDFMLNQMNDMVNKLTKIGVDAIIIACNTLTAETAEKIRANSLIPIIGIEPYLNYLNHPETLTTEKIALILTPATYRSQKFCLLREKTDPQHKIDVYPLPKLAVAIESLKTQTFHSIKDVIVSEINLLKVKKYTHLILGCTHYPIIKDFLEEELSLKCIDPSLNVIKHIKTKMGLEINEAISSVIYYNGFNTDEWLQKSISDFPFLEKSVC